jgi:hypothetical protein
VAVRPEGANHQWRRNPPGELSIDPVADERLVWGQSHRASASSHSRMGCHFSSSRGAEIQRLFRHDSSNRGSRRAVFNPDEAEANICVRMPVSAAERIRSIDMFGVVERGLSPPSNVSSLRAIDRFQAQGCKNGLWQKSAGGRPCLV